MERRGMRVVEAGALPSDPALHGAHVMTVCNACRYCEQYCPVFPAMEQRLVFGKSDLVYLANLCHNCGACLYACQYAPPHELGIDVPRTLARIRHQSYEEYAWPRWLRFAFHQHGTMTALLLAGALTAALAAGVLLTNPTGLWQPGTDGRFYRVIPHSVMVTLFGTVALAVFLVLAIGGARCWRDIRGGAWAAVRGTLRRAARDVLTLRHLHAGGDECVSGEEQRTPWRRRWHHCTFYGFMLCFASTSVAALYHAWGFEAPYAYTSVPVLLGTAGGLGLLVGPAGLWFLQRCRDPDLGDPQGNRLNDSFLVLLFLTSLTGLALMLLRQRPIMGVLLVVHLGAVLALFVTLPYGKFVHGLYRTLALFKFAAEDPTAADGTSAAEPVERGTSAVPS
jgi:citrate/tricarballylate utilization protein